MTEYVKFHSETLRNVVMIITETKIFENRYKDSNIGANSESGVRNALWDIAIFKNM